MQNITVLNVKNEESTVKVMDKSQASRTVDCVSFSREETYAYTVAEGNQIQKDHAF